MLTFPRIGAVVTVSDYHVSCFGAVYKKIDAENIFFYVSVFAAVT